MAGRNSRGLVFAINCFFSSIPTCVYNVVFVFWSKDILNATLKQREVFSDLVAASENLQLAEIPQWAGLGGVRYIPDVWLSRVHTDGTKYQLLSVMKSIDIQFLI